MSKKACVHFIEGDKLVLIKYLDYVPVKGDEFRIGGEGNEKIYEATCRVWVYDEPENHHERVNVGVSQVDTGETCHDTELWNRDTSKGKRGLFRTGEIKRYDWKLFECNQGDGAEYLIAWGGPEAVRMMMHEMAELGSDVWIFDPDGGKEVPS